MQETYDNDFYEEVGDILAPFRKKHGGGFIGKDGADPFVKDPDSLQGEHDEKLRNAQINMTNI